MNIQSIIVLLIVGILIVCAIIYLRKRRKKGKSVLACGNCCGDCSKCKNK